MMKPEKFRKKPVVIEAMQFQAHNRAEIMAWCGATRDAVSRSAFILGFIIETLEGSHIVMLGDWIIKGVKDEFYPCKPDIFAMTYELEQ